jgi:hypothetical protein
MKFGDRMQKRWMDRQLARPVQPPLTPVAHQASSQRREPRPMNHREVWAPARAVARIPSEMSSRVKPAKPKPTTSYEQIKADAGKAGKGCAWVIFYPFIMSGIALGILAWLAALLVTCLYCAVASLVVMISNRGNQ